MIGDSHRVSAAPAQRVMGRGTPGSVSLPSSQTFFLSFARAGFTQYLDSAMNPDEYATSLRTRPTWVSGYYDLLLSVGTREHERVSECGGIIREAHTRRQPRNER